MTIDATRKGTQAGRFAALLVEPRTVNRKERQQKGRRSEGPDVPRRSGTGRKGGGVERLLVSAGRGVGGCPGLGWGGCNRLARPVVLAASGAREKQLLNQHAPLPLAHCPECAAASELSGTAHGLVRQTQEETRAASKGDGAWDKRRVEVGGRAA